MSSEENPIHSVPHIEEQLSGLKADLELDGELYYHGMPFADIHSIVSRKVNQHDDFEMMNYYVFDVVIDWMAQRIRMETLKMISQACSKMPNVMFVEHDEVETEEEVFGLLYTKYQGYEGFIVRDPLSAYVRRRSTAMMKFKPKKQDFYLIVGCKEEISIEGMPKNSLGSVICCKDDQTFDVGSGPFLTLKNRRELWERKQELIGKIAKVEYQYLHPATGKPRHGVLLTIIDPKEA